MKIESRLPSFAHRVIPFYQIVIAKVDFWNPTESTEIDAPLLDRRYRSAALSCILCAAGWRCNFDPTSRSRRGEFFSEFNIYIEWLMTIIKKRGRIVRNIFVIDRYDWLLGRNAFTYVLCKPQRADVSNRMSDVSSRIYRFQIGKLRNQSGKTIERAIIVWNVSNRSKRSTLESISEGSCVNYSGLKLIEQPFDRNKRDTTCVTQGHGKLRS